MRSSAPSVETRDAGEASGGESSPARSRLRAAARSHWVFLMLFVLAAVLRFIFWQQLWPALMFADSWIYLNDVRPLYYLMYRPAGYVFVLAALGPEPRLEIITALQHMAGLATGSLVYVLCLRQGLSKGLALVPAALFLLNAFTLVLEQYLMTEAFFALLLLVGMGLAVEYPDRPGPAALSGLALALASMLRGAGLFALPFWLGWLIWKNLRNPRVLAAPLLAFLLPVTAYVVSRNAYTDYGTLSLIRGEGWFLYGRAMSFADCTEVKLAPSVAPLCPAGKPSEIPEWFVWAAESPARTFYQDDDPSHNEQVRGVALEIIKQQPLSYLAAVGRDFLRGFTPGRGGHDDASVVLAYDSEPYPFDVNWPAAGNVDRKFNLGYRMPTVPRDSFLAHYWRWARLPSVLLGLAVLLFITVATRQRWRRLPQAQAALLLGLTGTGMLGFAVATHTFSVRYVIPVVPLIASAGVLALNVIRESPSVAPGPARPEHCRDVPPVSRGEGHPAQGPGFGPRII